MLTINREFIVRTMPHLTVAERVINNRYYLYISGNIVIRIQSKNDEFELERKENVSNKIGRSTKIKISKEEYLTLKQNSVKEVNRVSYRFVEIPELTIREYGGQYAGFIRAEIYFKSTNDADTFKPYPWLYKEITGTPLSQDATMLMLTHSEFTKLLEQ